MLPTYLQNTADLSNSGPLEQAKYSPSGSSIHPAFSLGLCFMTPYSGLEKLREPTSTLETLNLAASVSIPTAYSDAPFRACCSFYISSCSLFPRTPTTSFRRLYVSHARGGEEKHHLPLRSGMTCRSVRLFRTPKRRATGALHVPRKREKKRVAGRDKGGMFVAQILASSSTTETRGREEPHKQTGLGIGNVASQICVGFFEINIFAYGKRLAKQLENFARPWLVIVICFVCYTGSK